MNDKANVDDIHFQKILLFNFLVVLLSLASRTVTVGSCVAIPLSICETKLTKGNNMRSTISVLCTDMQEGLASCMSA